MTDSYLNQSLDQFLDAVASREPAPGGGAVAATVLAMAAGLAGMAARFAEGRLDGAAEQAGHADRLRERAAPLAQRDADAYAQVVTAYRIPRESDPEGRRERIRHALRDAAEVPAEVARIAAEVAEIAAMLARDGNPNLAGDAVTASLLAEAAARSASSLVRVNVTSGGLDESLAEEAERCVQTAAGYVRQAGAA